MKIKSFRVTSLRLPLKTPYIWSQGVEEAFHTNLIEMEAVPLGYLLKLLRHIARRESLFDLFGQESVFVFLIHGFS